MTPAIAIAKNKGDRDDRFVPHVTENQFYSDDENGQNQEEPPPPRTRKKRQKSVANQEDGNIRKIAKLNGITVAFHRAISEFEGRKGEIPAVEGEIEKKKKEETD